MRLGMWIGLAAAIALGIGEVEGGEVKAGFGVVDITPVVKKGGKAVWIAGYGQNRKATGVHDKLYARAVVLTDGKTKVGLVSVDLVGLMRPEVLKVRAGLKDYAHVTVSSTHNHEGPDVIGLWGPSPVKTGVDEGYLALVVKGVIKAVREAESKAKPVRVRYGTANDEQLLGDSRKPIVKDGVLRVLKFENVKSGKMAGILVQWNCHPEAMGPRNTLLTADFPVETIRYLKKKYKCEVAYFTGAIGGLLAPPDRVVKDKSGRELKEGEWAYMEEYGRMVARLAVKAIERSRKIDVWPVKVRMKKVYLPLVNPVYRLAAQYQLIKRKMYVGVGDMYRRGAETKVALAGNVKLVVESEIGCLKLGELYVAMIPGELYPELVYGKVQTPADAGADFPNAKAETAVFKHLKGKKAMLFGLANDEVGYIIPKRQWDVTRPYAYGLKKRQYGEVNSLGPETAGILMKAFGDAVGELKGK